MVALLRSVSETKILVVDDTPDNLRVLAKMLEAQHYLVFKALNGKMALQAAHHNLPNLILDKESGTPHLKDGTARLSPRR